MGSPRTSKFPIAVHATAVNPRAPWLSMRSLAPAARPNRVRFTKEKISDMLAAREGASDTVKAPKVAAKA